MEFFCVCTLTAYTEIFVFMLKCEVYHLGLDGAEQSAW